VLICGVRLFYTGPVINTEMLVVMLSKHGIEATQEFVDLDRPEDGDLNREANVFVPEEDVVYLDISVEEAMKTIMSGGIYTGGLEEAAVVGKERVLP